ncbi:MAG: protein kinase [Deltaproteobacteria bacterium]|nr:protein kinase [Deltaproteobacteria bacterium]
MSVPAEKILSTVGRYQVIQELGRGGMGVVFLGEDPFIERQVAIKTPKALPPADAPEFERFTRQFFNEARTAGRLKHPNIVSMYDATIENGRCYLIMEYVDGSSLKVNCQKENLLPVSTVVKIIFQCAKALDYAHQNGIMHRDIKPANIMISKKNEVKISDFGIAKVIGTDVTIISDKITGSVKYASPEQLNQQKLTLKTDIFSLGIVTYELLTGSSPFQADSTVAIFYKINNEDPVPITKLREELPESLQNIVSRALQKNPEERYKSCREMAGELAASFDHLRSLEDEINFEEKFDALSKLEFFKDFSRNELVEILKVTQWVRHGAASNIISEGEIDDVFYIIISGKVRVKKRGKVMAELKPGDCFGEMAHLGHSKRTATIQAYRDTVVMKINSAIIEQTSHNTQLRFYKIFNRTLIQRLALTSDLYSKVIW